MSSHRQIPSLSAPVAAAGSAAAVSMTAQIEDCYRRESRAVLATLIRLLGDFDLAEEALHEAFRAAVEQWPHSGVPVQPRAWLVSAGRFKVIDQLRRQARFEPWDAGIEASASAACGGDDPAVAYLDTEADACLDDDRLRLIFTCCHPALSAEAQIALTLREVCALSTEEIAHAFLLPAPTLAQRIVRAKAKIRDARIPYEVPAAGERAERLEAVLRVVYLVFNEGYTASVGAAVTRHDLCAEAIRLGRLLVELLPAVETRGLLALMLLQDSRRAARTTADGELLLLDEQDRRLWDRQAIDEGLALVDALLAGSELEPYSLQAAIAAVHARATTADATAWAQIVFFYEVLLRVEATPVIALNHAVAVAMRDGPAAGLDLVEALLARGELRDYRLAHAARADFCRRLGRNGEARAAYAQALALCKQEPERRFLQRRLDALANLQEGGPQRGDGQQDGPSGAMPV